MNRQKAFLRQKFIEFQLKIAELIRAGKKQEEIYSAKEREYLLNLFEMLDSFESIEESILAKEQGETSLDKTARLLARNIRSLHKKLVRIVAANQISAIEFPDNKARMDLCIVVETREAPDMENETILAIVKKGYVNGKLGVVLRKAEVITVLN